MSDIIFKSSKLGLSVNNELGQSVSFVISSFNGFMIDYNQGASDMSFVNVLVIAFIIL